MTATESRYVDKRSTRVMVTLLEIEEAGEQPNTRVLAELIGCAPSTVHIALRHLRMFGLVAFDDLKRGTLRSTVQVVDPVTAG